MVFALELTIRMNISSTERRLEGDYFTLIHINDLFFGYGGDISSIENSTLQPRFREIYGSEITRDSFNREYIITYFENQIKLASLPEKIYLIYIKYRWTLLYDRQ